MEKSKKSLPQSPPVAKPAKHLGLQPLPSKLMTEFELASVERVTLASLRYDEGYQGPPRGGKVNLIYARFSPVLAGILIVSRRLDGALYTVDGLHRSTAAFRHGIKTLPAYVFTGLSIEEEAAIYDVVNTARKSPAAIAVFRSRLLQGLPLYVSINRAVERAGLRIALRGTKSPDSIIAVSALSRAYGAVGDDGLTKVLSILWTAWPNDPLALDGILIRGLSIVLGRYPGRIQTEEMAASLSRVSPRHIIREAHASTGIGSRLGKEIATAAQMLAAYNKGRRTGRLDSDHLMSARHQPFTTIEDEA